jgi:hypothetical protein
MLRIWLLYLFYLPPDECNEAGRPVTTANGPQVRVRGQQVIQDQAIALTGYAVTTLDVVSKMQVWGKIFKAGVMKLVRPDLRCR